MIHVFTMSPFPLLFPVLQKYEFFFKGAEVIYTEHIYSFVGKNIVFN